MPCERVHQNPDVYLIPVVLPKNALRILNCYVICSQGQNLIIDTGFNQDESRDSLLAGLDELNLDPTCTSLFITHGHSDHTGLVNAVLDRVKQIFISEQDYQMVEHTVTESWWRSKRKTIIQDGFSVDDLEAIRSLNPITNYSISSLFDASFVADGDIITVGDYNFSCIHTPGHTPGHICLYEPQSQLLFSGDHVLFNISPNISSYPDFGPQDYLGIYLQSLRKLKGIEVKYTLPGHRAGSDDLYGRIDELIHHHDLRLEECLAVLRAHDGITCVQVAKNISWNIRGDGWDDYPLIMRMFADGETLAHLEHLIAQNRATVEIVDGVKYFRASQDTTLTTL